MIERLRARNEWKFAAVLPQADRSLAVAWWILLGFRGVLPAMFAIALGQLIGVVQRRAGVAAPLALVGVVFILLQVLPPIHHAVGSNLGSRTAAWLYDRLTSACIRPPGMGHLESPQLTADLTMARDFDLGISGPPISISMDFIAGGLVEMVGGLASAVLLAAYAWWAPIVLAGAWLATHYLLRESGVWRDRNTAEVREAQRHADYTYRLAVEPPAALDAETEHALFDRYAAAARDGRPEARDHSPADGRIIILVSHRFSTVRMADFIVVLDGSRVVESGTHDSLMANNGQYADLYRIQAAAYR